MRLYLIALALAPLLIVEGWQFSPSVEGQLKDRQILLDDGYLTKNEGRGPIRP